MGVSTLFLLGTRFETALRTIRKSRFRHWEIFDDGYHRLENARVSELGKLSSVNGISYSVHGPICDLNIATLSPDIGEIVVRRLTESILHAANLGARTWILHPGTHGSLSWVHHGADKKINRARMKRIQEAANEAKLGVTIENISAGLAILRHVEDFLSLYREWPSAPDLCLDVGHSHITRQTDDYLGRLGDRLGHVHAHDNGGDADKHLSVGMGTINWKKTITSLVETGYRGRIIIESVKAPFASLRKIKGLLRTLQ